METLRFLHLTMNYPPAHFGGDARFVEYLSNELVRAGHEVHVFHNPSVFELLRKKTPELGPITEGGVHRHIHRPSMPRMDTLVALNLGSTRSSVKEYEGLLKEIKPDVVHWHNTKGFFSTPLESNGSISLYTAHDYFAVCPRSHLLRPGYRICKEPFLCQTCLMRWRKLPQLWRTGSRRAIRFPKGTSIISPSEFMAGRLKKDGIIADHLLRNFVPDTRGLVGERKPGRSLLYLGIIEKQKGVYTLLDAFCRSQNRQGFELWIVGEGSAKNNIRAMITEMKLSDRVKVPGFAPFESLAPILREVAAIIVPSENFENAPLVVSEAFSSGIPVIGSDIGGLPEMLRPESGSIVFPPGDASRLAEIIVDLWGQNDRLREMGRNARLAYERNYLPEVHLRNYLNIISGLSV